MFDVIITLAHVQYVECKLTYCRHWRGYSDMIPFGVPGVRRNRCDVTPLPNTQENWEESLSGGAGCQEMTQVYRAS